MNLWTDHRIGCLQTSLTNCDFNTSTLVLFNRQFSHHHLIEQAIIGRGAMWFGRKRTNKSGESTGNELKGHPYEKGQQST